MANIFENQNYILIDEIRASNVSHKLNLDNAILPYKLNAGHELPSLRQAKYPVKDIMRNREINSGELKMVTS